MPKTRTLVSSLVLLLLAALLQAPAAALAGTRRAPAAQAGSVTASDLILAMNTLRVSNGLPALIVDPIVMSVSQATADIMAASNMSWHIGDVRGRIAAAGYGAGATVWATENFAVGMTMGIDQIMLAWADPDHMRPATNPAYCHVGAGVSAAADGRIYYILQAAYTSENACGPYVYDGDTGGTGSGPPPVSQVIIPVQVVTPDADGKIFHIVKSGQSFWSIAVAYRITIADLEFWNNISRDVPLWVGQSLFIPSSSTQGYATPTPVGMVLRAAPDQDGRVVHEVEAYQTLITIADAYDVTVDRILALNGLLLEWPLSIGQELLIDPGIVTPSPTPRPLTAVEKLTPASDGNYYHVVQSGETLFWIAGLYEVAVGDLMAWNGLTAASIIQPDQRLLLQVTPPATATPTPGPATSTPTQTPTFTPSPLPPTPPETAAALPVATAVEQAAAPPGGLWAGAALAAAGAILLFAALARRRQLDE